MADWLREREGGSSFRSGFGAGFDDFDELRGSFNLARCVKAMVTGERAGLSDVERRALAEGTGSAGGFLLPAPLATTVIDLARSKTQVLNAGAVTLPMNAPTLALPRLSAGVSGAWKSENSAITEESQTYERVTFTAKTATTLIKLSRELFEDAGQAAHEIFEGDLVKALAAKLDYAALRGSGVDPEPKGILNQTGVNVVDMGTNGATPGNFGFLSDAVDRIRGANGEPNAVIYASRTATTLDKLADTTGQPLRQPDSVAKLTKLVSNQIPVNVTHGTATNTSEAYVADWSAVLIGVRPTLEVRVTRLDERYAEFGQVALVAWLRADVQMLHPQWATVVTGIKP
jgi:HK97 family phage major capsid protein